MSKYLNPKWIAAFGAMVFFLSLHAEAQQPKKIPRIGYLIASTPSAVAHQIQGFREGLRDLGYIEGKNILVEYRAANGKLDRLAGFADELVQAQVDVFVSGNPEAVRAARNASKA